MVVLVCILGVLFLAETLVLWKYQRQVKDICRQLHFLEKNDSNMLISRELDFGGVGDLADILNKLLIIRRKERRNWLEKEKVISDTYTNLSHDIRTPLTSLDGYFQLLEESQSEEERGRYLRIIQERINSLKEMLEELFTFTRLKNESYPLELTHCCMNRVLKDTIFSFYEDWQEQGIEPRFDITQEPLYMKGNVQALRRIVQNIIKNALDHGEKSFSLSLAKENSVSGQGEIHMEIRNETKHPEQIDTSQVFERFYKADSARSKNSTGLGLSIAREFVLKMNGTVRAYVEGTEFCVAVVFPVEDGGE